MRYGNLWACVVVAVMAAGDVAAQSYYVPDYYHRGPGRCRAYADPNARAACREQRRQERARRYAEPDAEDQQPQNLQQQQPEQQSETASQSSDLAQGVERFMRLDAQNWYWDSYDQNSVSDAQVESRAPDDGQTTIFARFTYNRGTRGWVRLRFSGGQFGCIELSDDGGKCRQLGASPSAQAVHYVAAAAAVAAAVALLAAVDSASSSNPSNAKKHQPEPCYDYDAPLCHPQQN